MLSILSMMLRYDFDDGLWALRYEYENVVRNNPY
jgi:hypothetical protein